MKNLPSGMYIYGNSVIHRLDATVKVILLAIILVSVVSAKSIAGYAVLIVFAAVTAVISRIGFNAAAGNIKKMGIFFAVIFIMNLCFYSTDDAWLSFWIFNPSYNGLMQGIKVVLRTAVFLVFCNILNVSTPPAQLTAAVENIIWPLRLFKVPVTQIALMLSVAVQFIPILFEEADMIKKAQISRGARFESKRLKDKAEAVMPMLVPVFVSAFRRADELSTAMEARGYRVDSNHTKKTAVKFKIPEIAAIIISLIICVLQIIWL